MKINKKIIKQALLVAAMMIGALSLLHVLPVASALALPDPEVDPSGTGEGSLRVVVVQMVDYFLGFLGLLAVIMVIYGGVLYVTAGGKEEQSNKAKKVIMFAVIGLIIILLSYALVNTVIGAGNTAAAQ